MTRDELESDLVIAYTLHFKMKPDYRIALRLAESYATSFAIAELEKLRPIRFIAVDLIYERGADQQWEHLKEQIDGAIARLKGEK
jgi:hypothetical protein